MKLLVITPTAVYATHRLREEANALGMEADFVDIKDLATRNFNIDITLYDVLYVRQIYPYFSKMEKLVQDFAKAGKRVVDASLVRGIDVSKWMMYQKLQEAGLPIPVTAPLASLRGGSSTERRGNLNAEDEIASSFRPVDARTELLAMTNADELSVPLILKWQYGFGAKHVFLVNDSRQLVEIANLYPQEELLVQEYIEADYEYKVITIGYKSLPVVTKYRMHAQNKVSDLETGEAVHATAVPELVTLAERAAKVVGRELAKVDILQKGNNFYILEVNRNPGLEPFEKVTGLNIARKFFEYLIL